MTTANVSRRRPVRRLLVRAGIVLAACGLVLASAEVAFAHFSGSRPSAGSTFSAGTVTLTSNVSGACAVTRMLPGSAPSPCSLSATYSGSISAYLALDIVIEAQAGNGGTPLYNPSDAAHDLQVAISSTNPTVAAYTIPTAVTACPGGAPSGSTCYEIDNELVTATAVPAAPPGTTVTFTTTVSLPASTTTGYRGGAAQVLLTVHATQAGNNSASACTAGHSCTGVHWS